ncbi:hypothetical protein F5Y15DRAFT_99757 [Xylariaceae sp. FL0016]|nr:hypothetical protein F5Y15DRAFT_99757 [Xylariaceae sp. FL0016]
MAAITNIWLLTLKDDHALGEEAFRTLWQRILSTSAAYTPGLNPAHTLWQSEDDAAHLAFITGFPSLEIYREADEKYTEEYMKPAFKLMDYQQRIMLHLNVHKLPLASDRITIVQSKTQPGDDAPGAGGRDVQADLNLPEGQVENGEKGQWIHFAPSKEAASLSSLGTTERYKRIMEAHYNSE